MKVARKRVRIIIVVNYYLCDIFKSTSSFLLFKGVFLILFYMCEHFAYMVSTEVKKRVSDLLELKLQTSHNVSDNNQAPVL